MLCPNRSTMNIKYEFQKGYISVYIPFFMFDVLINLAKGILFCVQDSQNECKSDTNIPFIATTKNMLSMRT